MSFVATILGIAIMFAMLLDAFEATVLPPIALAEVPIDNWRRSPWQQSAPGIGSLPITNTGDHF